MHIHARRDEALNESLGVERAGSAGDGGDDVHDADYIAYHSDSG
jgi:hypothetical protein